MNNREKEIIENASENIMRAVSQMLDTVDNKYIIFGGIGRERRLSWYNIDRDEVRCGCFSGTLAQYEDRVCSGSNYDKNTPHHALEYQGAIQFIKACRAARLKYPNNNDEKCCETQACDPTPLPPVYMIETACDAQANTCG